MAQPDDTNIIPPTSQHEPISALDRLRTVYAHPGPYVSVYLATDETGTDREKPPAERWSRLRDALDRDGAPSHMLEAVDARLGLPRPEAGAGVAVIVAADGTTVVGHGTEPTAHDHAVLDTLPYAAPLLEWDQRQIPHVVVSVDDTGAGIAVFGADHFTASGHVTGDSDSIADQIVDTADRVAAELVVLSGDVYKTNPLADRLASQVRPGCRIVSEPHHDDTDDLADAAVRLVDDTTARTTVDALRDQRFLDAHDLAVDGREDTIEALSRGTVERLLIHDDPQDQQRIWIGPGHTDLSLSERPGSHPARLVDAAIRSAVLQGVDIRIIPSTGPRGPAEDIAAITSD